MKYAIIGHFLMTSMFVFLSDILDPIAEGDDHFDPKFVLRHTIIEKLIDH